MGEISQTKTSIECSLYSPIPAVAAPATHPPTPLSPPAPKHSHTPNLTVPCLDRVQSDYYRHYQDLYAMFFFFLYHRHIPSGAHELPSNGAPAWLPLWRGHFRICWVCRRQCELRGPDTKYSVAGLNLLSILFRNCGLPPPPAPPGPPLLRNAVILVTDILSYSSHSATAAQRTVPIWVGTLFGGGFFRKRCCTRPEQLWLPEGTRCELGERWRCEMNTFSWGAQQENKAIWLHLDTDDGNTYGPRLQNVGLTPFASLTQPLLSHLHM